MKKEIAQYFSNKPEVAAVYLFGSQAKNKSRPFSDVDIAILLKEDEKEQANRKKNEYLVDLGRLTKKDIHPVIMNAAGEELLRQIFSTGICVLVNDEHVLSRFKTCAFVKIAEIGYYRKPLQRGIIRKLKEEAQNG
jgi:predicted nucleotidyltransferase